MLTGMLFFFSEMWERIIFHVWVTFFEICSAFCLGIIGAGLCAICMHLSHKLKRWIESGLVLLQAVPLFILSPLLILCIGFTKMAVIIPTGLMLIFPLAIALYKGSEATPSEYIEYYTQLGYSPLFLLFHLRLPFALPALFSGMRVAASTATIGALASEWAGGQAGLGVFIQEMRRNYDMYGVLTGILCTFLLSALIYGAVLWFERFFSKQYAFSK